MKVIRFDEATQIVAKDSENLWQQEIDSEKDDVLKVVDLEHIQVNGKRFEMSPNAQQMFCDRVGAPLPYLKNRCDTRIQQVNLQYRYNEYLKSKRTGVKLFLPMRDDQVRGLLTGVYRPITNAELMIFMAQHLDTDAPVELDLGENHMALSVVREKESFLVGKDDFRAGYRLSNSETGLLGVKVSTYILKVICTNGMMMPVLQESQRKRHVYSNLLDEWLPGTIQGAQEDVVTWSKRLQGAAKKRVDPEKVLQSFQIRSRQVSKKEVRELGFEQGAQRVHLLRIIDLVTRRANAPDIKLEERFWLQEVAGKLLEKAA